MVRANAASEKWSAEEVEQRPLSLRLILRTFGALGPYLWLVLLAVVLCVLCIASEMCVIREIKTLLDRSDLRGAALWPLIRPIFFYYLFSRVCGGAQWVFTNYATNKAVAILRQRFFAQLQSLSKRFYDNHKAGWLVARNTSDIQVISEFLTFSLMMTAIFAATFGFALTEMYRITPALLLACAVVVPAMLAITIWYKRRMTRTQRQTRAKNSELVANMAETARGIRVVHAFSREQLNLETFSEINRDAHDLEIKVAGLNAFFLPSLDFLGILNIAIVTGFGLWLVDHNYLTAAGTPITTGNLAACILYMNLILWPLRMMVEIYSLAIATMAAAERVFEIMDMDPEVRDAPDAAELRPLRGEIAFERVSFRYGDGTPWVLRDLDLRITAGETVALVGETGAGKTTIASLAARFYDAVEGRVLIDGKDVRACTQDSLHQQMGIVLQQGFLFSGTILDNLRFGRPELTRAEVENTARELGTHELIAGLPDGYETTVLEGGGSISLGQQQLVALTRAVVADPRILILDEPTSALDVYTERIIQNALERITAGRTTIIIAHRLSTVRYADRILVVDQGEIVESGSHEELLARRGKYHELVARSETTGSLLGVRGKDGSSGIPAGE